MKGLHIANRLLTRMQDRAGYPCCPQKSWTWTLPEYEMKNTYWFSFYTIVYSATADALYLYKYKTSFVFVTVISLSAFSNIPQRVKDAFVWNCDQNKSWALTWSWDSFWIRSGPRIFYCEMSVFDLEVSLETQQRAIEDSCLSLWFTCAQICFYLHFPSWWLLNMSNDTMKQKSLLREIYGHRFSSFAAAVASMYLVEEKHVKT